MAGSFEELRAEVEQAVGRLKALVPKIQAGSKDQGKQANSEVQRVLKEADRNVRALENEARASAPSQRRALQDVITELKSDLNAVRARIQKANDASSRADLMTGKQKQDRAETETRDRMVAAADTAVRSTGKLAQAQNLLEESQDIGINVIDTMQQQRETMIRSTDKTRDVNTLTKTARGILRGIQAKAITNKLILVIAILVILGCIGVVVYFGYIQSPKGK